MANVTAEIKQAKDFKYTQVLVPNPDGSYIDWIHLHGNTFNNKPDIMNSATNSPLFIKATPWSKTTPVTFYAEEPTPGFRYIIPISDTPIPEFTPAVLDAFLKEIDFKNGGVISGHSYGVARMMAYFAYPQRSFDFQAAIDVAGFNDGSVKSLPKLNFPVKFFHAAGDGVVNISYTRSYQSMLQSSGNQLEEFTPAAGGSHDLGRLVMNGPEKSQLWSWLIPKLEPIEPPVVEPQPDQVYPVMYNATQKYFFVVKDGENVRLTLFSE